MRRFLSRLVFVTAALPFGVTAAVVARYTFDDGQNGAMAVNPVIDSSGNAFHGTPINRPVLRLRFTTAAKRPQCLRR